MTTSVLICDDSAFARRQMAKCLPDAWHVEVSYAENGQQALQMIQQGKADVMFLDLNMPVMDGYQTMQVIRQQDLPTLVIVVSGDVQAQARERMLAMGALDFIRKPIDNHKLSEILHNYGLFCGHSSNQQRVKTLAKNSSTGIDKLDIFREMANVAMGKAGENLADLLDEFIDLPIPNVNLIAPTELTMAIDEIERNDSVSAVSKGFVGSGIRGEALVIFSDTETGNMVKLLRYEQELDAEQQQLEALMDVSNIITGACLNALSQQLNVSFSHYHPEILGRHQELSDLLACKNSHWDRVLAIEIAYNISRQQVNFDLLLLIPGQSIDTIYARLMADTEVA